MFKSSRLLTSKAIPSRGDRSIIFKDVLLNASVENEFGFQEKDILPLFVKYQSKRQLIIDVVSFLTYVLQLPTHFYLRRLQRNKLIHSRVKKTIPQKSRV